MNFSSLQKNPGSRIRDGDADKLTVMMGGTPYAAVNGTYGRDWSASSWRTHSLGAVSVM